MIALLVAQIALASTAAAAADGSANVEQRRAVAEFAQCVLRTHPVSVSRFVLSNEETETAFERTSDLMDPECYPVAADGTVTLDTNVPMLRYAFAEALLRANRPAALSEPRKIGPLQHGVAEGKNVDAKRFNIAASEFGDCVVRAASAQADALLRSEIGSAAETAALQGLQPAFSGCVPAGSKFVLAPETVRGTIALNYYRLAKAAEVQMGALRP